MRKLEELLVATTSEVMTYCLEELAGMGYLVMSDNVNFLFAVPRTKMVTPILYMAHMDTMRKQEGVLLGRHGDTIINVHGDKCGCLGADDRAGVFIVLNIAHNCTSKPYVLLTNGEEMGHTGAVNFIKAKHPDVADIPVEFYKDKLIWEPYVEDLYSVVQYDRKGMNEAAFYGTSQFADELFEIVQNLGYQTFTNSRSDSLDVQEALGIAGVNLSAGFLKQHTPDEMLVLPALNFAVRNGMYLSALIDERIPLPAGPVSNYPPVKQFPLFTPLPPKPDEKKIYQGVGTECDICGKKRPVIYIPHAMACVCAKCSTRAGGPSFITRSNLEFLKSELQKERDKSRARNQQNEEHVCPLCMETEDLSFKGNNVVHCNKCKTYFLPLGNMVCFWSWRDDMKRYYYRLYKDPVTIHDVTSHVPGIPLDWCGCCGSIHHEENLRYFNGFPICKDCDAITPR